MLLNWQIWKSWGISMKKGGAEYPKQTKKSDLSDLRNYQGTKHKQEDKGIFEEKCSEFHATPQILT